MGKLNVKKLLGYLAGFMLIGSLQAQVTPGVIFQAATPASNPLDPNGNGWITLLGSAFTANERAEFEIPYFTIPGLAAEPDGDPLTGGNCGVTDIVDNPNTLNEATYLYYDDANGIKDDGDDRMLYRIRCAKPRTSGNFGFNILLDTDNKFGSSGPNADPNAVSGNPGFELEIRIRTGGGPGVFIDNVDGTTSGTTLYSNALATYYQQSYAYYNDPNCTYDPVFHDVWVPMNQLGITSTTPVRVLSATSMSGNSALAGAASDIGGADDRNYPNQDSLMKAFIYNQVATSSDQMGWGGGGFFPIEMVNLTGSENNGKVNISWSTLSEMSSSHFTVSRSSDGEEFSVLESINAAGNSQIEIPYLFTDHEAKEGGNIYKISLTDQQGNQKTLGTILIQMNADQRNIYSLFPNPSNDVITINGYNLQEIQITDIAGKVVLLETFNNGNPSSCSFNLSYLVSGIYFVKIQTLTSSRTLRWVKQGNIAP